eukprot:scaffold55551_cov29-Tisochrysis_lutea.AAC.3
MPRLQAGWSTPRRVHTQRLGRQPRLLGGGWIASRSECEPIVLRICCGIQGEGKPAISDSATGRPCVQQLGTEGVVFQRQCGSGLPFGNGHRCFEAALPHIEQLVEWGERGAGFVNDGGLLTAACGCGPRQRAQDLRRPHADVAAVRDD